MANGYATPTNFAPPLLSGLNKETIAIVLKAAQERETDANETILNSGDEATQLYLLRRGRVRYYRPTKAGEEVLLNWLTPGDVFGLGTLLKNPTHYLASAQAISDCHLLVWAHARIRRLAQLYPQLAENAFRIVLEYLRIYADRHVDLVTKTAEERLAQAVLDLSRRVGRITPRGIEIDATNEQLGGWAQISPFTTSRVLGKWEGKGLVSKSRERLLVHTPEDLPVE
jgi:CRP-like cAMP-binding protein